jgi:glycosyltransferase involved in cell wall biosynthesis
MLDLSNTTVIIFTYCYPFGSAFEFIDDEIPFWIKAKRVVVISLAKQHADYRSLSQNQEAYSAFPCNSPLKRSWVILCGIRRLGVLSVVSEVCAIFGRGRSRFFRRLLALASHIQAAERYYQGALRIIVRHSLGKDERVVLYSYWLGPATHAALKLKGKLSDSRTVVVSRCHGSDLYAYSNPEHYLPFRESILQQCDRVFAVSGNGVDYVQRHWQCVPDKVALARLGSSDHFSGQYPQRNDVFSIVSCSYVTPVKRVNLIVQALSLIKNISVHWTHIGGGPGEADLQAECARLLGDKKNIQYELIGNLTHENVVGMFRTINFNALVNTSQSEGIPVSMMEAQCSGIPVIGTAVGGVKEIVNSGVNGVLLSGNASSDELAAVIIGMAEMDEVKYQEMCMQARANWCAGYSSNKNYIGFTASVADLFEASCGSAMEAT